MANETQTSAKGDFVPNQPNTSQLEYPQLLIEASFQSLLSHSQSSEPKTTERMPVSEHALSESWSSLSEHDLIHDDDLTSNATDTGSLIDVSTAEDIHSVGEAGSSSESEDDCDRGRDYRDSFIDDDGTRPMEDQYDMHIPQVQYQHAHAYAAENIRLDDSTVVIDSEGVTSLHASKTFHDADLTSRSTELGSDESLDDILITIKMSMSPESLKLSQQPYNILYHGSLATSAEIRADVLGKIGAALISSGESAIVDDSTDSPCYHVIPSEFGPGSKPSTADLIPIPTQMHVTNCSVLDPQVGDSSDNSIQLQLSTGGTVVSQSGSLWERSNCKQWTDPDLAIIVISQRDNGKERVQAEKIAEFATRHGIPLLCLRQEDSIDQDSFLTNASPDMLHKIVQRPFEYHQGRAGQKMLLDVDMFRLLDAEQLSQHINYLTASVLRSNALSLQPNGFVRMLRTCCFGLAKLLPKRVSREIALCGEASDTPTWILKSATPPTRDNFGRTSGDSGKAAGLDRKEHDFLFTAMRRIATVFVATLLTMVTYHACQVIVPHFKPERFLSLSPLTGQVSITQAPCMRGPLPPMASTIASVQTFALSGPLQAIEQQVQSWVPINKSGRKDNRASTKPSSQDHIIAQHDDRACLDIASSPFNPTLKLDAAFFKAGQPAFEVLVQRGDDKVDARIESQADAVAAIMVKRKDLHGRLTVQIRGQPGNMCASINLEDSLSEAFTHWIKNLHDQKQKVRTAKELANRYTRLLEIRTARPGLVNTALEMHYSAAQGIGAAMGAVEKSAVRHARACQQDMTQCFVQVPRFQFAQGISKSIQHAREASEVLIQGTHAQVVETAKQVRYRANEMTQQAAGEVSKAVQVVQSSIEELSILGKTWPRKMSRTLTKAQQQAQKLVPRPGEQS